MGINNLSSHPTETSIPPECKTIELLSQDEIDGIFNFLIGSGKYDTQVNKFVKLITKQENLEDYQRVLLAPANGIENLVSFFASLFTKQGYSDIAESIKNIPQSPKVLRSVWDVFYKKLSPTQKLAVGIEFGINFFTMTKVVSQLVILLRIIKISKKTVLLKKGSTGGMAGTIILSEVVKATEDLQDIETARKASKKNDLN